MRDRRIATARVNFTEKRVHLSCVPDAELPDLIGAFMALGFWLASRLPVKASVAIAVFLELFTLYFIRDNLTLNVLMLVWPLEAVRQWQAATI